jgi:hypothetical protein
LNRRTSGEQCKRCLRDVVIGFEVDDSIWEAVVKNKWNVLCPQCFDTEAQNCLIAYTFNALYPVSWSDWECQQE